MIKDIQQLLDEYLAWLKDKTMLREVGGCVEITTPYLDRHNDYLQIYVKQKDNGYLLTDDSYVIEDLQRSGCKLDSPKRKQLLATTLNGFGVTLNDSALEVTATKDNFTSSKHNLVQAMLAVNDLFYLASPTITSLFFEDIEAWLNLSFVRYTPKVKFTGKSGYDHLFDFVIPKSPSHPERILRTINRPNRDTAEAVAFSWVDTKTVRPPDSRAYAFLNDTERQVSPSVLDALRSYDVTPVVWSLRDDVRTELAA